MPIDPTQQQQPVDPQAMYQAALKPPQQPTDIAGILSNPLVMGALGTYLGAIGSPRSMGMGGAISRGGLMGLGMMGQQQAMQNQQQMMRSKMYEDAVKLGQGQQLANAATSKAKTYSELAGRYGALGPEKAARYWQQMPPEIQKEFGSPDAIAGMTEQNFTKFLSDAQTRAQRGPLLQAQIEAERARAAQERATAGAEPSLIAQRHAATEALNRGLGVMNTMMPGLGAPVPTGTPTAPAAAAPGGVPAHATTGEGLPPGSKPSGDADGSWVLPDGTKVWPSGG